MNDMATLMSILDRENSSANYYCMEKLLEACDDKLCPGCPQSQEESRGVEVEVIRSVMVTNFSANMWDAKKVPMAQVLLDVFFQSKNSGSFKVFDTTDPECFVKELAAAFLCIRWVLNPTLRIRFDFSEVCEAKLMLQRSTNKFARQFITLPESCSAIKTIEKEEGNRKQALIGESKLTVIETYVNNPSIIKQLQGFESMGPCLTKVRSDLAMAKASFSKHDLNLRCRERLEAVEKVLDVSSERWLSLHDSDVFAELNATLLEYLTEKHDGAGFGDDAQVDTGNKFAGRLRAIDERLKGEDRLKLFSEFASKQICAEANRRFDAQSRVVLSFQGVPAIVCMKGDKLTGAVTENLTAFLQTIQRNDAIHMFKQEEDSTNGQAWKETKIKLQVQIEHLVKVQQKGILAMPGFKVCARVTHFVLKICNENKILHWKEFVSKVFEVDDKQDQKLFRDFVNVKDTVIEDMKTYLANLEYALAPLPSDSPLRKTGIKFIQQGVQVNLGAEVRVQPARGLRNTKNLVRPSDF